MGYVGSNPTGATKILFYYGFLGCATKEITQHFGRYFGKEIFGSANSNYRRTFFI